jgi:hypothetical protein
MEQVNEKLTSRAGFEAYIVFLSRLHRFLNRLADRMKPILCHGNGPFFFHYPPASDRLAITEQDGPEDPIRGNDLSFVFRGKEPGPICIPDDPFVKSRQ